MFPEFAWAGQGNMGCGSKNEWRKSGTTLLIMWLLGYAFSLISGYVIILFTIPSYSRAYVCIIETWWVTKTQATEIYSIVLSTNCYNSAFYDCTLQVSTTAIKVNYPITSLLIKKCVNNNLLNLQEKMQLEQIISYLHELYGRKVIEGMTFDYCDPVSWKITGKKLMNHRWKYFLLLYIQSRKDFELPKATVCS